MSCFECEWEKYYYGRCMSCGNGFNKENWKAEKKLWEDNNETNITWDMIIDYYINDGFNHEGNGVCYSCAVSFCNEK